MTDLESCCVPTTGEFDSLPQERKHQELKTQLQKEIAINSENFEIRFADNSSYHSDPIVFNCSLKSLKGSRSSSLKPPTYFLRVEVSTEYPGEIIECSIQTVADKAMKSEFNSTSETNEENTSRDLGESNSVSLTEKRAVLSKRFHSSLNLTTNCSFSQALSKFYTFYHNSILVS